MGLYRTILCWYVPGPPSSLLERAVAQLYHCLPPRSSFRCCTYLTGALCCGCSEAAESLTGAEEQEEENETGPEQEQAQEPASEAQAEAPTEAGPGYVIAAGKCTCL